jgi:hypothetical protein
LNYLIQSVQTKTGAQTPSYSVGTDSIFLGLKLLRSEAKYSPQFSAEIKNAATPTLIQCGFMAWKGKFTFLTLFDAL